MKNSGKKIISVMGAVFSFLVFFSFANSALAEICVTTINGSYAMINTSNPANYSQYCSTYRPIVSIGMYFTGPYPESPTSILYAGSTMHLNWQINDKMVPAYCYNPGSYGYETREISLCPIIKCSIISSTFGSGTLPNTLFEFDVSDVSKSGTYDYAVPASSTYVNGKGAFTYLTCRISSGEMVYSSVLSLDSYYVTADYKACCGSSPNPPNYGLCDLGTASGLYKSGGSWFWACNNVIGKACASPLSCTPTVGCPGDICTGGSCYDADCNLVSGKKTTGECCPTTDDCQDDTCVGKTCSGTACANNSYSPYAGKKDCISDVKWREVAP